MLLHIALHSSVLASQMSKAILAARYNAEQKELGAMVPYVAPQVSISSALSAATANLGIHDTTSPGLAVLNPAPVSKFSLIPEEEPLPQCPKDPRCRKLPTTSGGFHTGPCVGSDGRVLKQDVKMDEPWIHPRCRKPLPGIEKKNKESPFAKQVKALAKAVDAAAKAEKEKEAAEKNFAAATKAEKEASRAKGNEKNEKARELRVKAREKAKKLIEEGDAEADAEEAEAADLFNYAAQLSQNYPSWS